MSTSRSTVVIYRLGSIGDTVVALPCFHLVRKLYPDFKIILLTNRPADARTAPAASVLQGSGLVDDYITYPVGTRDIREIADVRRTMRALRPELLIYLTAPRGSLALWRDALFFQWCGIRNVVGVPFRHELRRCRPPSGEERLWERESQRLARCIVSLGDAEEGRAQSWDLGLLESERAAARHVIDTALATAEKGLPLVGLSIGTKQAIKDWGDDNWRAVLDRIAEAKMALILVGGKEDHARSAAVAQRWPGPVVNLCGALAPRISAAVMQRLSVLLCHDSGPMHLAAAVGTRCVAVFCAHRPPGQWFPFGAEHSVFYPATSSCAIRSISPAEVAVAARALIGL